MLGGAALGLAARRGRRASSLTAKERQVGKAIEAALPRCDDLRRSPWRGSSNPVAGHCSVASEAAYHLLGGKRGGYTPMFIRHEGAPHWFLRTPEGAVLDITAAQFRTPVPYAKARGKGFQTPRRDPKTGIQLPSKRAQELITRVGGRGRRNIPFEFDEAHPADFGGLPWLYHHTDPKNIPYIVRNGLMGGDGRNWDDPELVRRSTGRVYFATDVDSWARGYSVPLRVRPQDVKCQYDHNWELMFGDEYKGPETVGDWRKHRDCYVTLAPHERISPRLIQILDEDEWGNDLWVPLLQYGKPL